MSTFTLSPTNGHGSKTTVKLNDAQMEMLQQLGRTKSLVVDRKAGP